MDGIDVLDELERRLIATHREATQRSWRRRRRARALALLAATATGTATVAAGVLSLVSGGVTPTPAQAALERAADNVSPATAGGLAPGRVWRTRVIQTWRTSMPLLPHGPLTTSVTALPTAAVDLRDVIIDTETSSGRLTTRVFTTMRFADATTQRQHGWQLTGHYAHTHAETTNGDGRLISPLMPTPLISDAALRRLPTDPGALLAVIAQLRTQAKRRSATATSTASRSGSATARVVGSCCGNPHATGDLEMITALLALPVSSEVRSALYRTAARLPGVRDDGPTRDILGRRGIAVSVGDLSGAHEQLVFDPDDGALLAQTISFGSGSPVGPITITLESAHSAASSADSRDSAQLPSARREH